MCTTLWKIMMLWVDNTMWAKIVKTIEQMSYDQYAIVAHELVIVEVQKVMYILMNTLQAEMGSKQFYNSWW